MSRHCQLLRFRVCVALRAVILSQAAKAEITGGNPRKRHELNAVAKVAKETKALALAPPAKLLTAELTLAQKNL